MLTKETISETFKILDSTLEGLELNTQSDQRALKKNERLRDIQATRTSVGQLFALWDTSNFEWHHYCVLQYTLQNTIKMMLSRDSVIDTLIKN